MRDLLMFTLFDHRQIVILVARVHEAAVVRRFLERANRGDEARSTRHDYFEDKIAGFLDGVVLLFVLALQILVVVFVVDRRRE